MRIGIVGAMPEEISLLKEDLTPVTHDAFGSRDYYSGMLYNIYSILAFCRWGKVAAATTALTLITRYKIDCLIFTGVAGAVAKELNVGDIVVGNKFYQHDMDARPMFQKHEIPLTNKRFFTPNDKLVKFAENASNNFISSGMKQTIAPDTLQEFSISKPTCYKGTVASGDLFVNTTELKESLQKDVHDVLAVEMEGAAVAQVCSEHNVPYVVIRTISDKADKSAAVDFTKFVNSIACQYSKSIVKNIYQQITY